PTLREGGLQRARRSGPPTVTVIVPHGDVLLEDLDTCAPQARDHLRVTRVPPLEGSEVTESQGRCCAARAKLARPLCGAAKSAPQEGISSTSSSARSRS